MYRSNTDEKRKGKTMKRLFAIIMMLLTELEANGTTVTLKGDAGQYTLAIWKDGSYSYSLSLSDGLSLSDWQTLISSIQS